MSLWEGLDKALTVTLKLVALGAFLLAVLTLSFCSDQSLKAGSTWTFARLQLAGLRPEKFTLLGIELAATGADAGNAAGLASDLLTVSQNVQVPQEVRDHLKKLAGQVKDYAQQLSDRESKFVSAIKSASRPPAHDAKSVGGWVYLGRRSSSGAWAPVSDKIKLPSLTEHEFALTKDAVRVEKDPAAPSQSESVRADENSQTIRLIRAGDSPLKILSTQESPSIGGAKLIWARVDVAPSELYEVRP